MVIAAGGMMGRGIAAARTVVHLTVLAVITAAGSCEVLQVSNGSGCMVRVNLAVSGVLTSMRRSWARSLLRRSREHRIISMGLED